MKLGLVTDSLVDRSLAEAAAVCRGLGLEQVELGCGNWSPAPHVDLKGLTADAGARHRLLDTLGENGLTISALNCSGNPLFPGEKGAGDRAVAEGTFLLAEQLGVETVVMMSGLPGGCPEDRTPTWIVTSWGMRSSSISLRRNSYSVSDAAGKPTSISLNPMETSRFQKRSLRSESIGLTRA